MNLAVACGQSGLSVTLAPFLPPVNYTLKNPRGILGRISLFKPSYKLGEDVTGTFDFSSATIACLQVSIHHHMDDTYTDTPTSTLMHTLIAENQRACVTVFLLHTHTRTSSSLLSSTVLKR